jgi:hypothetical protein
VVLGVLCGTLVLLCPCPAQQHRSRYVEPTVTVV